MYKYEDDTPFVIPENLKGLSLQQLRERVEKLYKKHEKFSVEKRRSHQKNSKSS